MKLHSWRLKPPHRKFFVARLIVGDATVVEFALYYLTIILEW